MKRLLVALLFVAAAAHADARRVEAVTFESLDHDAPRVRMRRCGNEQQRDEQPLQSSSRNRRSSRHATSFAAIGRVYAGLVDGSTSVAYPAAAHAG